jgi:hypothetical protein
MLQAPVAYGLQYTIKSKWKKLFILVLLFQPREQKVGHLVLCFSSQVLHIPCCNCATRQHAGSGYKVSDPTCIFYIYNYLKYFK